MSDQKNLHVAALIEKLRPSGDVLIVGFGNDTVAIEKIKSFKPTSITIIENDASIADTAKQWANQNSNVKVIVDTWQNALPTLKEFDAILLNDYQKGPSKEELDASSTKAKEVLKQLEEQLSRVTIQFSDKEIEDFYQKMGQFNRDELPHFFAILQKQGNIIADQYKAIVQKYKLEGMSKTTQEEVPAAKKQDFMLQFFEQALKHIRKGGRFSSFLNTHESKYADPIFFEKIISNPALHYSEELIPINESQELVMVIEKP